MQNPHNIRLFYLALRDKLHILLPLATLLLAACSMPNYDVPGMFNGTSPEVATRFSESMAYNEQRGEMHLAVPADYRVYVCTDSHIDTTHHNLERFVLDYKTDTLCSFAIHLGDLINAHYYENAYQVLQTEPAVSHHDTLFITPGNHDIYFNQWADFRSRFHTSAYWFDTYDQTTGEKLDLYISFDSAEGTLGTAQLKWLRNLLKDKSKQHYRHIILFTHTHLYKQDTSQGHTSNYAMEETYEITGLMGKYGVDMYWCGHDHSRQVTNYAGTTCIIVNTCQDPEPHPYYMVVEMGSQINYRFVSLK